MTSSIYRLLVLLCLLMLGVHCADAATPNAALPSLAVLVHAQPGGEELADPLRALLEAETTRRYEGPLVERAELASLLQEMKLSSLLGDANSDAVQTGKMEKAAFLVLARVSDKAVRVTVTGFPKTDIALDKTYTERLEPESLAERIAADALTAIRSRERDPLSPYVSIGSFYCLDPHRRYFDFGRAAETELRKQLNEVPYLRLVERMFPSDLLNEFNLARGGMTVSQSIDFNAPPADLLIYGECTPQKNQDLNNAGLMLDCTLTVLSPTNLLPPRSVTVVCRSDDSTPLVEQAKALVSQAVAATRDKLAKGTARSFSMQEFISFKKQAFRLMVTPPRGGDESAPDEIQIDSAQDGPPEELERALRMLECASLFTGDDTEVLTATAATLMGLTRGKHPEKVRTALTTAAMELVERAYRKKDNRNTRGFYAAYGLYNTRPEVVLAVATHIWGARNTEPWQSSVVDAAFKELISLETDWTRRRQFLIDAMPMYEKKENGLSTIMNGALYYIADRSNRRRNRYRDTGGGPNIMKAPVPPADYAVGFVQNKNLFLQALGHMMYIHQATQEYDAKPDPQQATIFVKHFRAAIALLPKLTDIYQSNFVQSYYTTRLYQYLLGTSKILSETTLAPELVDLQEEYVLNQLHTEGSDMFNVEKALHQILPSLRARHEEARAITLLTEYMKGYKSQTGDIGFATMLNQLNFEREKRVPLTLADLTPVAFDDGETGWTRRLVPTRQGIFGLRLSRGGGRLFRLPLQGGTATLAPDIVDAHEFGCNETSVAVGTTKSGLYLVDATTLKSRQLTSKNSALPGDSIPLVAAVGTDFYIGIADKDNYIVMIHRLSPEAGQLTATDMQEGPQPDWYIIAAQGDVPIAIQNSYQRTTRIDGKEVRFETASISNAILQVNVVGPEGQDWLTYRGFELSHVNDFTIWQGYIVFATHNGLYISKPGTNQLQCIMSEPDTFLLSLCPIGDRLYLGSSKGLHFIDAAAFIKIAGKAQ